MEVVKRRIKYDHCHVANSIGKSGDLIVFWNSQLNVVSVTNDGFFIEIKIDDKKKTNANGAS